MLRESGEFDEKQERPRTHMAKSFDEGAEYQPGERARAFESFEDREPLQEIPNRTAEELGALALASSDTGAELPVVPQQPHRLSIETAPTMTQGQLEGSVANQLLETHPNLAEFNVSDVDFTDNPILDDFQNKGATPEDYEWLVQTFSDQVRPAVEAGATRDDLEAIDQANDSEPMRKLTDAHDAFLGGDPIKLETREDGTLNPIGGRHRIEMARRLGIPTLVGEVRGGTR